MSIADRMKKIRGLMTQKDFAEKIGLTSQAILNYERHGRTPKKAVVSKLCEIFGVSEDWLLTGEGPMYEVAKTYDMSEVLKHQKTQHAENIKTIKNKTYDMSEVLEAQREIASLQRELLEVYKKNVSLHETIGTLQVTIERTKMEAERQKYRIAELERELVRVLKGDEAEDMASAG